jgi:hypothetical protein
MKKLEVNTMYQLPAYADDVNLLDANSNTTKKNTETILTNSREVV